MVAPPAALIKLKTPPRTHSFFDARNTLGFATLGASLTADALSTQKGLAYPGFAEMNPIARPFVQSRAGAAVYNAGSFGLMAGLMYWAHKKEHHKLERILPFAVGSWEGLLSAKQLSRDREPEVKATKNHNGCRQIPAGSFSNSALVVAVPIKIK